MGNLPVNIIIAITILWINITSCQPLTTIYTQRENPSKDAIREDDQQVSIKLNHLKEMGLLDNTYRHIFRPKADIIYGPNNVKMVDDLLKRQRQKFHPYWSIPNKMRRKITRTQQDLNKMRKKVIVKPNPKTGLNSPSVYKVGGNKKRPSGYRGGNKRPPPGYRGGNKRPPSGYRGGNKRPQPRPNKRPPCRGKLCKYKKKGDSMKPIKGLEELKQLEDISVEFRVDPNYNQDEDYPDMGQDALAGYQLPEDYGGMGWVASEYFPLQGFLPDWPFDIFPYYPPEYGEFGPL